MYDEVSFIIHKKDMRYIKKLETCNYYNLP